MNYLVAALFALAAALGTSVLLPGYRRFLLLRGQTQANHQGLSVPSGVGLVAALWASLLALLGTAGFPRLGAVATGVAAFTVLGLLDDMLGDRSTGGLRGHFTRLWRGDVTSGAVKAIGGAAVAIAVAVAEGGSAGRMVLTAVLLALSANAVNLLDLRPGRAIKVAGLLSLLMFALWPSPAAGLGLGVSLALLPGDLAATTMLGDAGSNPLGFLVGAAIAYSPLWVVALAVALFGLLHLATERGSISRYVADHPWLSYLDRLGRSPSGNGPGRPGRCRASGREG